MGYRDEFESGNQPSDDVILLMYGHTDGDFGNITTTSSEPIVRNPDVVQIEDDSFDSTATESAVEIVDDSSDIEILSDNPSNITLNNSSVRSPYKCSKCKQTKRGHICLNKNSSLISESNLQRKKPPKNTKSGGNDESSDPNWVPPNGINTSSTQILPRRAEKRKISTPAVESADIPLNKKSKCGYCRANLEGHKVGQPKQCPQKLLDNQRRQLSDTPLVTMHRMQDP